MLQPVSSPMNELTGIHNKAAVDVWITYGLQHIELSFGKWFQAELDALLKALHQYMHG